LFNSGFEASTVSSPVVQNDCYSTGCWQRIMGTDASTGYSWPFNVWGSGANGGISQLHADVPVDATSIRDYAFNQIVTLTGHKGLSTKALYRLVTQSGCCGQEPQSGATQNALQILPASEQGDLYISYWQKFQPGMADLMQVGLQGTGWNWRDLFAWKTAGDYRIVVQVRRDPFINGGNLFWAIVGDNEANGGLPYQKFWELDNTSVPVPVGEWFKFEVFWHRSAGSDGRVWVAINGQMIGDHGGSNMGVNNAQIDRIFLNNVYSSTAYPIYQWIDDLQIWSGFPPVCTDSPCAPH